MNDQQRVVALEKAREGDAAALGLLLQSFSPYMRVIVHGMRMRLGCADDSDLIQDAMLEANRCFASFKGTTVAEFTAWLRTIVQRTAGRHLRRLETAKRDAGREQPMAELAQVLADSGSSPSAQAMRHEQAAAVAAALTTLPEDMQQVLLGRHIEDLSHAELAQKLNRTEAAVRMLYLRALRRLREVLETTS